MTRRVNDQSIQVDRLDPDIKNLISYTAAAKANTTLYEMQRQIKSISFEGRLVNDVLSQMPVMGDVKLSTVQGVSLETDLEKLYQKDQEKQRVVTDSTGSKMDASTVVKVDE